MKSAVKRVKGFLLAFMYIAVYYISSYAVYNLYFLWQMFANGYSSVAAAKAAFDSSYIITAVSWGICLLLYMFIGKIRKLPLKSSIRMKKEPPITYTMATFLAIGCRFLVVVYYSFAGRISFLEHSLEKAASELPPIDSADKILIALLCSILIAPIFEELLFRGLVMGELLKVMRPWAANVSQALVFGIMHGVLFQSVFAALMGLVLGELYFKTKNIKISMVSHAVFNLSAVLTKDNLSLSGVTVYSVAGLLLMFLSLYYLYNNAEADNQD